MKDRGLCIEKCSPTRTACARQEPLASGHFSFVAAHAVQLERLAAARALRDARQFVLTYFFLSTSLNLLHSFCMVAFKPTCSGLRSLLKGVAMALFKSALRCLSQAASEVPAFSTREVPSSICFYTLLCQFGLSFLSYFDPCAA